MLRIGIIGSGFGGIGLLPAFNSIKSCEVVALCGKKSEKLAKYCSRIGFFKIYGDWRTLLDKEELDAVAIAVRPNEQYEIAKYAIFKGLHVFAEKPLAVNVAQAKVLLNLARKKKITHGIDFIFPEIAQFQKVKELIDQETFGRLKHISVSWDFLSGDIKNKRSSWKTDVGEGGGVLSFYFSHGLYYLEHFAGKIIQTKSLFTHSYESVNGGEVGIDMLLKFKDGIFGNVHVSCNSAGFVRHRLIFQCEGGVIVLENKNAVVDNFVIKTYGSFGTKEVKIKSDIGKPDEDERVKIVRKLAVKFVNSCIHNSQMSPSFFDGLRVQELIERIRVEKI